MMRSEHGLDPECRQFVRLIVYFPAGGGGGGSGGGVGALPGCVVESPVVGGALLPLPQPTATAMTNAQTTRCHFRSMKYLVESKRNALGTRPRAKLLNQTERFHIEPKP